MFSLLPNTIQAICSKLKNAFKTTISKWPFYFSRSVFKQTEIWYINWYYKYKIWIHIWSWSIEAFREEFKLVIRVCMNKLKFKLKYYRIPNTFCFVSRWLHLDFFKQCEIWYNKVILPKAPVQCSTALIITQLVCSVLVLFF